FVYLPDKSGINFQNSVDEENLHRLGVTTQAPRHPEIIELQIGQFRENP
ncbi:MAG: hypothetical protein RJA34_1850, partial [Pseudomonadota bacterium]